MPNKASRKQQSFVQIIDEFRTEFSLCCVSFTFNCPGIPSKYFSRLIFIKLRQSSVNRIQISRQFRQVSFASAVFERETFFDFFRLRQKLFFPRFFELTSARLRRAANSDFRAVFSKVSHFLSRRCRIKSAQTAYRFSSWHFSVP